MEKITDWIILWRELSEGFREKLGAGRGKNRKKDSWRGRARQFDNRVKERWSTPDSSRDFIISLMDKHPGSTVLDIGAGSGAWSTLLARHAQAVTAVEPSHSMAEVMRENLHSEDITNVSIVEGSWPDVQVEKHDFSLSAHSMYLCPDLVAFIRHMVASTTKYCFLLLRAPASWGVYAEAAMHLWGQPYDSPNFQIAYNALLQMGIQPNVLMEDMLQSRSREYEHPDEALFKLKKKFGLKNDSTHDDFFKDLLNSRLTYSSGKYVWPVESQTALVYWDVRKQTNR